MHLLEGVPIGDAVFTLPALTEDKEIKFDEGKQSAITTILVKVCITTFSVFHILIAVGPTDQPIRHYS